MNEAIGKQILYVFLILLLFVSLLIVASTYSAKPKESSSPDVFVGVDATFGSVEDMKAVIDKVKSYTNFFVIGSTAITNDLANITEVCQYLNASGLKFLTYAHPAVGLNFSQVQWFRDFQQKYDSSLVGLYAYDEPGGHQIDHDGIFMCVQSASNYSDAAGTYVKNLTNYLNGVKLGWETGNFPLFVSDYALYEYDYRAGYNVVLTEFAWNQSRQLNAALCRGAATVSNGEWGVMITGGRNDTILPSGKEMYNDMVLAYQNGAKYIIVFDYPNLADGILKQEHFDALKQFWQYIQSNPRVRTSAGDRVAYVLPADYGYGFRGSNDKIWGLWQADSQSAKIWNETNSLVTQYGTKLDIIYQDDLPLKSSIYSKLIFWNDTIVTLS